MKPVVELEELLNQVAPAHPYHELLRIPTISAGIYILGRRTTLHREDEIYYVVRGQGKVRIGAGEQSVREGSTVFVEAGREHRFFDITEQLVLLVIFAAAETVNYALEFRRTRRV